MTATRSLRLTALLVAAVATGAFWASAAQATTHALGGNGRFQIGNGLPIPIGGTPPPNGRVKAVGGATAMQPTPGNGQPIQIPANVLKAPGNAINLPVWLSNSNVLQVRTAIPLSFPKAAITFSAGNRTGAPVVAFCPGDVVTANGNPNCTDPGNGVINGLMRYTATKNQFGGPARGNVGGSADVALRGNPAMVPGVGCAYGGGANPGCLVAMALATPQGTGAQGATFGVIVSTMGMSVANGVLYATVTGNGKVLNPIPTGMGNVGPANPATSYGGPWTTGMLTVSVTQNLGATSEIFMLTGKDARAVNGAGALSLVAGAVSDRTLSDPNANRGWLNLQIGPPSGAHVPLMPLAGLAAFGALAALTGGYALRKRNR